MVIEHRSFRDVRHRSEPVGEGTEEYLSCSADLLPIVEREPRRAPAGPRLELSPLPRLQDVSVWRGGDECVPPVPVVSVKESGVHGSGRVGQAARATACAGRVRGWYES